MNGILIIQICLLVVLLFAVSASLVKYFMDMKKQNVLQTELKKTLKKNVKKLAESDGLIPDAWLKNENPGSLEPFLNSAVEQKLTGSDVNSFLSGLMGGNDLFSQIFTQILSSDSEMLTSLAKKLGISPMIAKPILIVALTTVAKLANTVFTKTLERKFSDSLPKITDKKVKDAIQDTALNFPKNFLAGL